MAATGSPSLPQQQHHDDDEALQNEDLNASESRESDQPPPQQPPHSETLETVDIPNPLQLPLLHQNYQQSEKDENHMLIPDEDDQHSLQEKDRQSDTPHSIIPEPIILSDDTRNAPQPPLPSPVNTQRRLYKRKKPGSRISRRKKSTKKVQNLTGIINPIPFIPKLALDFRKHDDTLMRLGLYEFSKIELDLNIRSDLLVELIVNYDPKKRCSYVNGYRINVNRADLARALKLPPPRPEKVSSSIEEVDLDSEVFTDDAIAFIDDFVSNWMLLHEDSWVTPTEILSWTRCIKDGHPEKLDSASLIWHMVEKELARGVKLVNCYYASHLQYLIRSQRETFYREEDDGVPDEGVADEGEENVKAEDEKEEKYDIAEEKYDIADDGEEIAKDEYEIEEKYVVADDGNENVKVEEKKGDENLKDEEKKGDENLKDEEKKGEIDGVADNGEEVVRVEEDIEEKDEKEQEISVAQEHDIELNLGPEVEEVLHEEVKEDDEVMVEADEHNEDDEEDEMEEQGGWLMDGKNDFGDHFLQRCQSSDLNSYEERKPEEVEDEQIEQVEDEEEEEGGERGEEGFDMEANDDALDRDGMTDNFLQGVETHISFGSQSELRRMPSMDLFGTRDGSFMSHGGPSFFGNGGKRVMEAEEDIHLLDRNGKRLKTEGMWDQKPNDFGMCMDQIQQLMEHAKMMYMSKEQSHENSQYNQQLEMNSLQERQNLMEMIIKSKDEELQKKDTEVFRLERELYLMGELVSGYRKALHETRSKFADFRKHYGPPEEPLYKDAGPGGLVLSTRELEKLRLKQEEDNESIQMLIRGFEQEYDYQFRMLEDKVLVMVDKLGSFENEVTKLKEISTQRKVTHKPRDDQDLNAPHEDNKTSLAEQSLPAEPEQDEMLLDEPNLSAKPEEIQKSPDVHNLPADLEENQMPLDEPHLPAEPEATQKLLYKQNLSAEPEEDQTALDESNSCAKPEGSQKSLNKQNFPAVTEENLKSPSEHELSVEPEVNEILQNNTMIESVLPTADELEKSMNEQNIPVKTEENLKSQSVQESFVEPGVNPPSLDEVPQNNTIMGSVPLEADELEEKSGSKD